MKDNTAKTECFARLCSGRAGLTQAFQGFDVEPTLLVIFAGRFEDEGFVSQFRVRQNAGKTGFADFAFADVFVAIEVRAEGAFGIVGVDYFDEVEAENFVGGGHG